MNIWLGYLPGRAGREGVQQHLLQASAPSRPADPARRIAPRCLSPAIGRRRRRRSPGSSTRSGSESSTPGCWRRGGTRSRERPCMAPPTVRSTTSRARRRALTLSGPRWNRPGASPATIPAARLRCAAARERRSPAQPLTTGRVEHQAMASSTLWTMEPTWTELLVVSRFLTGPGARPLRRGGAHAAPGSWRAEPSMASPALAIGRRYRLWISRGHRSGLHPGCCPGAPDAPRLRGRCAWRRAH